MKHCGYETGIDISQRYVFGSRNTQKLSELVKILILFVSTLPPLFFTPNLQLGIFNFDCMTYIFVFWKTYATLYPALPQNCDLKHSSNRSIQLKVFKEILN